eukprot:scaffold803_cov310-Pinguiococcus_pyrenoidosus.AAC.196
MFMTNAGGTSFPFMKAGKMSAANAPKKTKNGMQVAKKRALEIDVSLPQLTKRYLRQVLTSAAECRSTWRIQRGRLLRLAPSRTASGS